MGAIGRARRWVAEGVRAGAIAGAVSGLPSTVHAVATGRSPLAAARAAGAVVGRPGVGPGLVVHAGASLLWGVVLAAALPRRHPLVAGPAAGLAIAALDLGVVGRRLGPVRDLPVVPQVLDHVAFATVAALALARHPVPPPSPLPLPHQPASP